VILAAGEGSRLGPVGDDVPKPFEEIDGRTLYDRQCNVLADFVDRITVVLGYRSRVVQDDVGPARTVVVENWHEYDNAESLRRALEGIDDDALVLNGDVVVAEEAVARTVRRHERTNGGRSVVAALPGTQNEHTAVRCDEDGLITDYGRIEGYRHAGLGVIDQSHVDAATDYLGRNRSEWYPVVYPKLETELVTISPYCHVEINRPKDMQRARYQLLALVPPDRDE